MGTRREIHGLVDGGDWACYCANHEALARIAAELRELTDGEPADLAREIAATAVRDLPYATALWARLASILRFGHPPRTPSWARGDARCDATS
jgi:hypothetical protein